MSAPHGPTVTAEVEIGIEPGIEGGDAAGLQRDYRQLQHAFQELLEQAHINQQIMQRHQAFDIRLLAASDLPDLLDIILRDMGLAYELPTVSLFLIDPAHEMQQLVAQLKPSPERAANLHFIDDANTLHAGALPLLRPLLARYSVTRHQRYFFAAKPASVAVVPLLRHQLPIGYLALGSADATRFNAQLATDFLERQASFIAICIENAVNYERLKLVGLTDPLTGVHNRRYIEQRMRGEISNAQRQETELSCLYIDIDFFKQVNDTVGHQGGDDVLCEVAARIKRVLRVNDAMGRFGGEEFIVVLSQTGHAAALRIAERIRLDVAAAPILCHAPEQSSEHPSEQASEPSSARPAENPPTHRLQVSISVGVASCAPTLDSNIGALLEQTLSRADQALYLAKESGRNRVVSALRLAPPAA